jgi:hypothetical protein
VGGQCHAPAPLPLGKRPGTHCTEAEWVPGSIWMGAKNPALAWVRSPDRPSRREFLYQLHSPGPQISLPQNYKSEKRNVCSFCVFITMYVSRGVASLWGAARLILGHVAGCINLFFGVWQSLPTNSVIVQVLKLSRRQNSMKFSRTDSHVKIWRFSYVSELTPSPPSHPEDGDGVSTWSDRKPSHLDVAVCPRKFRSRLYVDRGPIHLLSHPYTLNFYACRLVMYNLCI